MSDAANGIGFVVSQNMNAIPLLSFIPDISFCVVFGVWSLVTLGLWLLKKKLVAGLIGLVGLVSLGMIILPDFWGAKTSAERNECISNLSQIEAAKRLWADEHHKSDADAPADGDLFGSAAYLPGKPTCPSGGSYTLESVGENPVCSQAALGHFLAARKAQPK